MQPYKIIQFDKTNGSIAVEFAPDMAPVFVDIPIKEDGTYITGEELDTYVQGFIPSWFLERKAKIEAGIPNEAEIEALVVPPEESAILSQNPINEIDESVLTFENYETEKLIAKALLKWGLLKEDPTIINNTKL